MALLRKYNSRRLYFRYLAGITCAFHTAFTYHRTWETGLEEVTRVSSSNPSFFAVTNLVLGPWLAPPPALAPFKGSLKSNQPVAFFTLPASLNALR